MKSVDEFSVKTLEIAGLGSALQALRLPFGKECRSIVDIFNDAVNFPEIFPEMENYTGIRLVSTVLIHNKDKALLSTLVKRGNEHAKVLRGVMVWCEINAPRYWWVEMDTYRVGAERLSSESTMHIEGKGLSDEDLVKMKEALTEGHMQKRIWMFSYQTLRRIYFQRRDHKLPQWKKFCEWITTLPFAKDFITLEDS